MPPSSVIFLAKRTVVCLPGRAALHVRVLRGRLWLTHTGCRDDLFVTALQSLSLRGHRIVMEAEEDSEIQIHIEA